jgi:hypothetical protein
MLTHPNVRGMEFPFNHMFGKQDHSVPKGRAGSLCSHVYIYIHIHIIYLHTHKYIHTYIHYIHTYIQAYIHLEIDR